MVQSKEQLRTLFEGILEQGDVTTLNTLFRSSTTGALRRHILNEPVFAGYTALQKVALMGNADMCVALLEHGAILEARGKHDRSAIHAAVIGGDFDTVAVLLLACADSFAVDENGLYPIDLTDDADIKAMIFDDMERKGGSKAMDEYTNIRSLKRLTSEEKGIQIITHTSLSAPNSPSLTRQSSKEGWNVTVFNSSDRIAFGSDYELDLVKGSSPSSSSDEGIEADSDFEPLPQHAFYQLI